MDAIKTAREYKDIKFPPVPISGGALAPPLDPAITAVDAAITVVVDAAITVVDAAITDILNAIKTKLDELNALLNNFKSPTPPLTEPSKEDLEAAIDNVKVEHNKLFTLSPITGGAPLRFGSPSSKTKRNRRRNRRFAKKSYKRRH